MEGKYYLVVCLLTGALTRLVEGQYGVIPPGSVVEEYKRQLEDDVYAVERKAHLLAGRECIVGSERFNFCSLDLNYAEFLLCLYDPQQSPGSDATIRGIKFPSSAFDATPVVTAWFSGLGIIFLSDGQVNTKDVSASGFIIEFKLNTPSLYPYFASVQWLACPAKAPLNSTVREFKPKYHPAAPPYFPLNYGQAGYGQNPSPSSPDQQYTPGQYTYDKNQPRYDDKPPGYEESSLSVVEQPSSYRKSQPSYGQTAPNYGQISPNYGQTPSSYPQSSGQDSSSYRQSPQSYGQASPSYGQSPSS